MSPVSCDEYRAVKILNYPVFDAYTKNNTVTRRIFGVPIYQRKLTTSGFHRRFFHFFSIGNNGNYYLVSIGKFHVKIFSTQLAIKKLQQQIIKQEQQYQQLNEQYQSSFQEFVEVLQHLSSINHLRLLLNQGFTLNDDKIQLRNQINRKTKTGDYQLEATVCPCGTHADELLAIRDRYGINIKTVICRNCGLIRANPYYTQKTLNHFYNNEYRPLYTFVNNNVEIFFQQQVETGTKILNNLKKYANFNPKNKKVYEIGTGMGGILKPFLDHEAIIKGVDVGQEYIQVGKNKGLDLAVGDYSLLKKYPPADLIILNHVLEHMTNPIEFLQNLRSLIKKHTLLYIAVPTIETIPSNYSSNLFYYLQNAHAFYFSQTTLNYIITCSGYCVKTNITNQGAAICQLSHSSREKSHVYKNEYANILTMLKNYNDNYQIIKQDSNSSFINESQYESRT